ncbi:MAG: hypothetical protein EXQ95_05680 [Alphaproteobacteria bacterium]|nr:hypothetical protein [Alphaproteobacteria bacterium]
MRKALPWLIGGFYFWAAEPAIVFTLLGYCILLAAGPFIFEALGYHRATPEPGGDRTPHGAPEPSA